MKVIIVYILIKDYNKNEAIEKVVWAEFDENR